MVFRQIRLEVDLAASIREDELVLLVQRDSGASDVPVNGKRFGRNDDSDIDEAFQVAYDFDDKTPSTQQTTSCCT